MGKTRIIFIGTSSFGLPAFYALAKTRDFEIILAVTQPDKPSGRRQIVSPSPIKIAALKHKISVLQPARIIEIKEKIAQLKPDLIIVAAYAQLIPEEILDLPKFGCLNLHASLLPKYRGSAVIPAAILNGDQETGLSLIKMDKGLDTGPILRQISVKIDRHDTSGTLYDKLSDAGSNFLIESLKLYVEGKISPRPQAPGPASFVKTLTKSDGLIDWSKPAENLEKFIRAMSPWPIAWTWWRGKQIKIISAQTEPIDINSYKPGKTFKYNNGLAVQCGNRALIIKRLQFEGKTELTSQEFLRGQKDFIGQVLG